VTGPLAKYVKPRLLRARRKHETFTQHLRVRSSCFPLKPENDHS
jgi:hypothetical protein